MTLAKKHSFAELMEAEKASKSNSDLLNLANAMIAAERNLKAVRNWLKKTEEFTTKYNDDIKAMVARIEGGEEVDVKEIKTLYDRRVPEFEDFYA